VIPEEAIVEIPLSDRLQFGELLGRSTAMRELFALMERLAPTEASVLIEGESGTGKELVAEAIHHASRRKGGPLIVVDCGALPSSLIESELFGHVKGAFTGADHDREGVLEAASGGTVFLDEIGELPLALQPRLLRFLEHRQVRRVGSGETKVVDVRVIAATNRDLTRQRREGRFRDDLYYRLSVVRLEIPPLRDRPEDIKLLAMHMAQGLVRDPREIIDDATLALLRAHDWPGNVRELRNVVERLAYLPKSRAITGDERGRKEDAFEIPEDLFSLPFHDARTSIQKAFEARYLSRMLQLQGGVVARAASAAKLPRQTFHRLLKAHGLR
ncbi:MAG: sigma-54-dependent Fis family transcriptional regulator, partial [Deltaproteobacteria bacterium]|nr:sigma-54-dependent Fis family transcriptional regulator [Deltaproteobacteria bacterium]